MEHPTFASAMALAKNAVAAQELWALYEEEQEVAALAMLSSVAASSSGDAGPSAINPLAPLQGAGMMGSPAPLQVSRPAASAREDEDALIRDTPSLTSHGEASGPSEPYSSSFAAAGAKRGGRGRSCGSRPQRATLRRSIACSTGSACLLRSLSRIWDRSSNVVGPGGDDVPVDSRSYGSKLRNHDRYVREPPGGWNCLVRKAWQSYQRKRAKKVMGFNDRHLALVEMTSDPFPLIRQAAANLFITNPPAAFGFAEGWSLARFMNTFPCAAATAFPSLGNTLMTTAMGIGMRQQNEQEAAAAPGDEGADRIR